MNHWQANVDDTISGYPALRHKITKELCMSGEYGEVWENNNDTLKAVIWNASLAKRIAKVSQEKQDEIVITFSRKNLSLYIKWLKIPALRSKQMDFSERHFNADQG